MSEQQNKVTRKVTIARIKQNWKFDGNENFI